MVRHVDADVGDVEADSRWAGDGVRDAVGESGGLGILHSGFLRGIGETAAEVVLVVDGDSGGLVNEGRAGVPSAEPEFPVLAAVADEGAVETADALEKLPRAGENGGDDEAPRGVVGGGEVVGGAPGVDKPLGLSAFGPCQPGAYDDGARIRFDMAGRGGEVAGLGDGVAVEECEDLAAGVGCTEVACGGGAEAAVFLRDDGRAGHVGHLVRPVVGDDDLYFVGDVLCTYRSDDAGEMLGGVVVRDDDADHAWVSQSSFHCAATSSHVHDGGSVGPDSVKASMAAAQLPGADGSTSVMRPGSHESISRV